MVKLMEMGVVIGHLKLCNIISFFIFMNRGTKKVQSMAIMKKS